MFIDDALGLVYAYLKRTGGAGDAERIKAELLKITGRTEFAFPEEEGPPRSYEDVQNALSRLNERESIRKSKGVYYTPGDVVRFILNGSVKALYGKLNAENIGRPGLSEAPVRSFCAKKTVFDPTCGAGEFLLAALEMKFDLLEGCYKRLSAKRIAETAATICGNDVNPESVMIAKLRLFLCAAHRYGAKKCAGLSGVMKDSFCSYDYVQERPEEGKRYSVIVGNPPYVEDSKSDPRPPVRYGNIYANVLIRAAGQLEKNGSLGFIVPLSYISTPRMETLRQELFKKIPEQYILSYADRPDCLFDSVHQKLCILIGKERRGAKRVYTGNYQYWYKEERERLFSKTAVIRNPFYSSDGIPKLGTAHDVAIFRKITDRKRLRPVYSVSRSGCEAVYLNRRETFWMKAFRTKVEDPEYKVFRFASAAEADYCYCLINSSLFWWYWISTSDCWHVSKELNGFLAPFEGDYERAGGLAAALQKKLETTKVFVGTKQTEYEYKHRACVDEIHAIDDYINGLFGLTDQQSRYIKAFAYRYRTSGGADSYERN